IGLTLPQLHASLCALASHVTQSNSPTELSRWLDDLFTAVASNESNINGDAKQSAQQQSSQPKPTKLLPLPPSVQPFSNDLELIDFDAVDIGATSKPAVNPP